MAKPGASMMARLAPPDHRRLKLRAALPLPPAKPGASMMAKPGASMMARLVPPCALLAASRWWPASMHHPHSRHLRTRLHPPRSHPPRLHMPHLRPPRWQRDCPSGPSHRRHRRHLHHCRRRHLHHCRRRRCCRHRRRRLLHRCPHPLLLPSHCAGPLSLRLPVGSREPTHWPH